MLVDAGALKAMLADGQELAIVDLREELIFSQSHLLFARSVPLSRLELKFARLVPRRGTRIVLCDDADGLVERAADILARAGYTNLHALDGGVAAWAKAGFELFSGVNVPSKAFGEFIEHASATPSIDAAVECIEVGVAGAREDVDGPLDQAVGVVAQHDARAPPRHQAGEFELEPAQRHRAREQEMALREDQLLAQVDDRQLLPVGEHRLQPIGA